MSPVLQSGLFENAVQGSWRDIVGQLARDSHAAGFLMVLILAVATPSCNELPAVIPAGAFPIDSSFRPERSGEPESSILRARYLAPRLPGHRVEPGDDAWELLTRRAQDRRHCRALDPAIHAAAPRIQTDPIQSRRRIMGHRVEPGGDEGGLVCDGFRVAQPILRAPNRFCRSQNGIAVAGLLALGVSCRSCSFSTHRFLS